MYLPQSLHSTSPERPFYMFSRTNGISRIEQMKAGHVTLHLEAEILTAMTTL
jgi:hypothetical protein